MNYQKPHCKASKDLPEGLRLYRPRNSQRLLPNQPAGAEFLTHADRFKPEALWASVIQLLSISSFRMAAGKVSEYITAHSVAERFPFVRPVFPRITVSTNHEVV